MVPVHGLQIRFIDDDNVCTL